MSEPVLSPDARHFEITLADGTKAELRYSWPALARAEEWLSAPWYRWDLFAHRHLPGAIAAGLLHADKGATPESVMDRLDPSRLREYREVVDDAVSYAHTGKTRAERIAEAKVSEPGEAKAATPTP